MSISSQISQIDNELLQQANQARHCDKSNYSLEDTRESLKFVTSDKNLRINSRRKSSQDLSLNLKNKNNSYEVNNALLFDLLERDSIQCPEEIRLVGKLVKNIGRLTEFSMDHHHKGDFIQQGLAMEEVGKYGLTFETPTDLKSNSIERHMKEFTNPLTPKQQALRLSEESELEGIKFHLQESFGEESLSEEGSICNENPKKSQQKKIDFKQELMEENITVSSSSSEEIKEQMEENITVSSSSCEYEE